MTEGAAEMTRTVAVSDEVRAAITGPVWNKLCATFELAPYQRCIECGQTIDLRVEPATLNERWFGQPFGHGFWSFEAVSLDDGSEPLVLLVELQMTDVVFGEDADGGPVPRSGVLEALVQEDGFAYMP